VTPGPDVSSEAEPTPDEKAGPDEAGLPTSLVSPGRLYGLADGVFAISMTLLALEVRIPEDVPGTAEGFIEGRGDFYSLFGIFLLAFAIAGRFWVANHWMLARLHHVDAGVVERLLPFLAGICSLPVATSILFRFGDSAEAVTFAAVILAASSLFSARLAWYIGDPERGLSTISAPERVQGLCTSLINAGIFLLAVPVAYLLDGPGGHTPSFATLVWLLLILVDRVVRALLKRR
jgi:uncharacterized membrane protein